MRYGSVCSGVEAATVAWHPLGWQAAWYSEIEPFPSAVLKHHYPTVPNYGDMTQYEAWPDEPINLLVGGTPCQSFSVAGLRKGLADPRGNLMLTYGAIAKRYRPEWLVWENVPGVLSSNGGRDFGTFLGMLAELGYGFAYRVLDAQYFGVAQRRRRVFVVGHLGNWQRAAAVLFERHSLQGHPAPSREKGQGIAAHVEGGVELCGPLNARDYKDPGTDGMNRNSAKMVPVAIQATIIGRDENSGPNGVGADTSGAMFTLTKTDVHGVAQPIPYDFFQITAPVNRQSREPGDPCHTLARDNAAHATIVQPITQFGDIAGSLTARHDSSPCADRGANVVAQPTASAETAGTLRANAGSGFRSNGTPVEGVAIQAMQVRRLTPVECERLQGFPDGYTNIPWRNKAESPDGPRYKAMGNSMAVPVMRWIGERIAAVEAL
jgi:DNA (cytosine-5)-methyltransferase 1